MPSPRQLHGTETENISRVNSDAHIPFVYFPLFSSLLCPAKACAKPRVVRHLFDDQTSPGQIGPIKEEELADSSILIGGA